MEVNTFYVEGDSISSRILTYQQVSPNRLDLCLREGIAVANQRANRVEQFRVGGRVFKNLEDNALGRQRTVHAVFGQTFKESRWPVAG